MAASLLGSFLFLYAWLVSRWARQGRGTLKAESQRVNPSTAFGRRIGRALGRKPKRIKYHVR